MNLSRKLSNTTDEQLPICVDLDGTLILGDTTWMSCYLYVGFNPLKLLQLVWWLLQGRAHLKHMLGQRVSIEPKNLQYRKSLLTYLKKLKAKGHHLYLVTATDIAFAKPIAEYVGLFEDVFASDGVTNLRAQAKADKLVQTFGAQRFVYAGNSFDDLYVWQKSAWLIVCSNNVRLLVQIENLHKDTLFFE